MQEENNKTNTTGFPSILVVVIIALLAILVVVYFMGRDNSDGSDNSSEVSSFIQIQNPADNTDINSGSTFTISGIGKGLFENNVFVQVKTSNGQVLFSEPTTMTTQEVGGEGTWTIDANIILSVDTTAEIIASSSSPKDGSIVAEDKVSINIKASEKAAPNDLQDTSWILSSYTTPEGSSDSILEGAEPTANFTDTQINGVAACNNYFGGYTISEPGTIEFSAMGATQKLCEEDVMVIEGAYLGALAIVTNYELTEESLIMSDEQETVELIFIAN